MTNDLSPPLGQHGGPRPGAGRPKKGENRERKNQSSTRRLNSRAYGTSRAYVICRLERDGFTELAAKVRAGEMSAYAASAVLGWAHRPQMDSSTVVRRRVIDIASLIG
jgi:hypothetical protein